MSSNARRFRSLIVTIVAVAATNAAIAFASGVPTDSGLSASEDERRPDDPRLATSEVQWRPDDPGFSASAHQRRPDDVRILRGRSLLLAQQGRRRKERGREV